jgi:hypothetical protein
MEPASGDDPLDGNGAFFKYSINGGGSTDTPGGHSSILTVNGEGAKNLSFSPVDLAGNTAGPTSVKFGIDATRPSGHFEPQDPDRPTLIRAPLTDAASGIENAWLQIRNLKSTAAWTLLPTSVASFTGDQEERRPKFAIASARFPDTKLPMGTFEARLITVDQAGNQLITTRDRSGDRFFIDNPMRDEVNLTAAIFRGGHRCKAKRARKCIRKRKGSIYLQGGESSARVGYRRAGIVRGFLTTGNYSPLAREPLEVYTREPGKPEVLAGTTSARADGSFYFRLKPGVNRKVRIYYPGTDHLEDADAGVSLGTAARMSLRVNRHHARTGQSIQFIGRAKSFDGAYPASRKIIALQFYTGGKWRPAIAIARTDKRGRFSIEYRFDRIPPNVKARIKFRVMAPAELGWNHVTSASKRVIVTVN